MREKLDIAIFPFCAKKAPKFLFFEAYNLLMSNIILLSLSLSLSLSR
jgi:hypothetical protein